MAFGNDNQKRIYDYYSRLKIKDAENESNGLELVFNYKNGMLVPVIQRMRNTGEIEYDTLAEINITQTKAAVLINSIDVVITEWNNWKADGAKGEFPYKAAGVMSGMKEIVSIISFDFDATTGEWVSVNIGKVDGSGNYLEKHTINFRKEYHYGIIWTDAEANQFEMNFVNDVDFRMFMDVLHAFKTSMGGGAAYAILDMARYDKRRILNKMDPIYDKLGIERLGTGANNNYSGNNYYSSGTTRSGNSLGRSSFSNYMNDAEDDELPFS